MATFLTDLRKKLEEASGQTPPWGDINPLVVIGLTEAILDLGLNEDQIYSVIRSYGRQLAAQVHPDKQPANFSPERQRQILGAFDILDNRENFTRALTHFRTLKAEDRRETRILQQSLSAFRHQVSGFESQFEQLDIGKRKLREGKQAFKLQKLEEPLVVPDLEAQIAHLTADKKNTEAMLKSSREHASNWKRQFEHVAEYFAYVGEIRSQYQFGIHATDAKWVAVASPWPFDAADPSPLDEDGKVKPAFFKAALTVVKKKTAVFAILKAWERAVAAVGTPDKLEIKRLPLGLTILELEDGIPTMAIGHRWAGHGGRVIGCLPPDKLPMLRSQLKHQTGQNIVFETIHPFIVPDGFLVSVRGNDRRKASWSITCPAIHFSTKRLILAVG
jgi:hypothetical protein